MKTTVFMKKLQTYRLQRKMVTIEYKPCNKPCFWCIYGSKYPNLHYTPHIVRSLCEKECVVKLSDSENRDDFMIVRGLKNHF